MVYRPIHLTRLLSAAGLAFAFGACPAMAQQNSLWQPFETLKQQWSEKGLELEMVLTAEASTVVSGNARNTFATPGNFDLVFTLDTETAGWWGNGSFLLYFLGNSGDNINDVLGDLQGTSNIAAYNTLKIYEASYEHRSAEGRASLLFGLHDLNSDFYALEHAGIFLNGSFGIGIDLSQVSPSIFPTTALAMRYKQQLQTSGYLMFAVYDGVPGNPEDDSWTHIKLAHDDGLLYITETGISDDRNFYYKVGLGSWYQSSKFEDIAGLQRSSNYGLYLLAERDIFRTAEGRGAGMFLQLGFSDNARNQTASYAGMGFTWTGALPSRADDVLGVAVGHARNSSLFMQLNPAMDKAETVVELSYLFTPLPWLTITPDLQYLINPGTDRENKNAAVLSLRMQYAF